MRRIEQVNELLKNKLSNLISREMPLRNGLVTIAYVDCSPDLRNAKIGVSVLPFYLSKNVLKKLKKHSSSFTQILKKETRLRQIPKFNWEIDSTEKSAAEIEKILEEISLENKKTKKSV
jgi:ribosome-binding factor A